MAQVAMTALEPYSQDFNSLPITGSVSWVNNATLPGWYLPDDVSLVTADNGASSTEGVYSYGSQAAPDRALGAIDACSYKLVMKNSTGGVIRHFKVRFRVEMWHKSSGHTRPVKFSCAQAPQIDPADAYTETPVAELQADVYSSSSGGKLNGNNEFLYKEFLIQNVNLPAGHEIQFTWKEEVTRWGLAIDEVVIEPTNVVVFYNNNLTDLTSLSSWGTNKDGSSTQPLNFTDADQVFRIANYPAGTVLNLPGTLSVGGTNSRAIVGDGTNAITLRISNNHSMITSLIEVADNATLAINASTLPQFGTLSPGSIVVFEQEAPAEISQGDIFGTLVLKSGKISKFQKKVKIKGRLVLQDGKLELGDNDLELDYGASLQTSSPSNYVVINGKGRLRQGIRAGQEVTLPIGKAAYNPVKIKLAPGSQDDIFSLQVLDGVYGAYTNDVPDLNTALAGNVVNKTWIVSEDVQGGSDITLTLSWSPADALTGFDPTNCHVKHYEQGVWDEYIPGTATSGVDLTHTTFSMSRSGITSFSPFTVSSQEMTTLLVELLHFEGKATEANTVVLSWATAMKKNNDHFAIEVSEDGRHFREAGRVPGAGNSQIVRHYTFTHRPGTTATTYYRLRQTDLDQTFTYSRVVAVAARPQQGARLTMYPNPGKGLYYLSASGGGAIQAWVSDLSGKLVLPAQPLTNSGGRYALDLSGQRAGIYLVHLAAANTRQVLRLVKQE